MPRSKTPSRLASQDACEKYGISMRAFIGQKDKAMLALQALGVEPSVAYRGGTGDVRKRTFLYDTTELARLDAELQKGDLTPYTNQRRREILAERAEREQKRAVVAAPTVESIVATIETAAVENASLPLADTQLILEAIAEIKTEQMKQRDRDRLMYQALQKLNDGLEKLAAQWQ
jgi:hypothetical protein